MTMRERMAVAYLMRRISGKNREERALEAARSDRPPIRVLLLDIDAMLDAMREPTEAMIERAEASDVTAADALVSWQAMITVAKEER